MLNEKQALAMLAQGALQLPPLTIDLVELGPLIPGALRLDCALDIRWGNRANRYAVEYKSVGTPRNLDAAVQRITRAVQPMAGVLPMVIAPYLSEEKLDSLAGRGVSGIDLCGNAVVIAPGEWFVYRSGKPNRFPSTAPIKNVYAGTSSMVGRLLFNQRQFERLVDLQKGIEAAGAQISLSTVSKVIRSLEDELIVSKRDGIRLRQPELLLDRLADNYERRGPFSSIRGRFRDAGTRSGPSSLLERVSRWAAETGARFVVSGSRRYAGSASSDTIPPLYTDQFGALAEQFDFEAEERFATAEIRDSADPLVYFDARQIDGVTWQGPLQTYLEMSRGGKRERELAATVRAQILGRGGSV